MSQIDWDTLAELRDDVGAKDFDEIVALFFEETEEALARLDQNRAHARMADDLHFLRGSALNMGFLAFSQACATTEKAPDQLDVDRLKALYAAAKQTFVAEYPAILLSDPE